jgi:hypothetical protein
MSIPAQFALGRRCSRTQSVGLFDFSEVASSLSDLTGNLIPDSFFSGLLDTAGKIGVDITTKEIVSVLGPSTPAGKVAQQAGTNITNATTAVSQRSFKEAAPPTLQMTATQSTPPASSDSSMLMLGLVAIILLTRK